jgi:pentatricopeptide repeat protein
LQVLSQLERRCCDNTTDDDHYDDGLVAVEVMRVCGRSRDFQTATDIYRQFPTETARTLLISILGSCQRLEQALQLLSEDTSSSSSSAASYNAAIAACGKGDDWRAAVRLYRHDMPRDCISTLTVNAVLTVLADCRRGPQALEVWNDLRRGSNNETRPPRPDRVTYQLVVGALVRSGNVSQAESVLRDMVEQGGEPTEAMLDLVAAAYAKDSDWEGVRRIEGFMRRHNNGDESSSDVVTSLEARYRFQHWTGLEKLDSATWRIGSYLPHSMTVGVRPNRNPAKNGIQLVFYSNVNDETTNVVKRQKIGYLLIKNSYNDEQASSSLLGVYLDPRYRGGGLAKACLAVWLKLCLEASIQPVTGIIRKPLLALLLQRTFHFRPKHSENNSNNGVVVEISQDPSDPTAILLYSPTLKSIKGAFSPWDLERQNIKLLAMPLDCSNRGREVKIGCALDPPADLGQMQGACQRIVNEESWQCSLSCRDIQQIFLGKLGDVDTNDST